MKIIDIAKMLDEETYLDIKSIKHRTVCRYSDDKVTCWEYDNCCGCEYEKKENRLMDDVQVYKLFAGKAEDIPIRLSDMEILRFRCNSTPTTSKKHKAVLYITVQG